jgi:tripartite-type tricarboxylate transporter receptor subunit TctC
MLDSSNPTRRGAPLKVMKAALGIALLAAIGTGMGSAGAQSWPERSITLIVPFAAGGASDISSRIMAEAMGKQLGQSVIVENVAGAGGGTGGLRGKNAKPDGYTIGFGHMGTHAASVSTNAKLPYDPTKDFDYLGIHLVTPHVMITRKDFPPTTLQEYIDYAKKNGKGLKIAHNGAGSLSHLTCVVFFQEIGVDPTYVVYRGYGQTINDILSGAVDGTCELIASVRNHVLPGAVKAFAVATNDGKRTPLLPDVPTSAEGGLPTFKIESWLGLYAPKGLPPEILAKLRSVAVKVLDEPEVQQKFRDIGGTVPKPEDRGGDRMLEIVKADVARWAEVVKKAGPAMEPPKEAPK